MQVRVSQKDHYRIMTFEGSMSHIQPGPLPEVEKALREGVKDIVLDFSLLGFLGTIGVKGLEETIRLVQAQGAHLGITSPQRQVRRMLKLSGLTKQIPIYFSVAEAVEKLDLLDYQPESLQDSYDVLLVCQKELPIADSLRNAMLQHPMNPQFRMNLVRDMKDAYEELLKGRVDCVVLDCTFPVFQVASFIEKVQTDDRIPQIPILVVAPDDRLSEAEIMIRHGVNELLRFPLVPAETVVRLQTLISHMKDHRPYYPPGSVEQPRGFKA